MKYFSSIFVLVLLFAFASISFAQTDWKKYPGNPVLSPGPAGAWDEVAAGIPSVLFDGTTYHMWYNTLNDKFESIGYATSTDGITWEKYNNPSTTNPPFALSDPVLNPGPIGSWDEAYVFGASVLRIDTIYYMLYGGGDNNSHTAIGLATSTDGFTWIKDTLNNPVLKVGEVGTWDNIGIQLGSVVFNGDTYHMWYYSWDNSSAVRIGHATSPDLIIWTKDPNNPVMQPSYGWEYPQVRRPNVIFDGTTFHMWYSGGEYYKWRIGYAWSTDGSDWTKYIDNPVLNLGTAEEWDDYASAYCSVLLDTIGNTYKMWYSGSDEEWSYQTGYATSPIEPNGIKSYNNAYFPTKYSLYQNYPNPFNPNTVISWKLAVSSNVELSVYNLLGQKVATLISGKMPAGYHEVEFNGKNLASGIYLYKIETAKWQDVKKMILLR